MKRRGISFASRGDSWGIQGGFGGIQGDSRGCSRAQESRGLAKTKGCVMVAVPGRGIQTLPGTPLIILKGVLEPPLAVLGFFVLPCGNHPSAPSSQKKKNRSLIPYGRAAPILGAAEHTSRANGWDVRAHEEKTCSNAECSRILPQPWTRLIREVCTHTRPGPGNTAAGKVKKSLSSDPHLSAADRCESGLDLLRVFFAGCVYCRCEALLFHGIDL